MSYLMMAVAKFTVRGFDFAPKPGPPQRPRGQSTNRPSVWHPYHAAFFIKYMPPKPPSDWTAIQYYNIKPPFLNVHIRVDLNC